MLKLRRPWLKQPHLAAPLRSGQQFKFLWTPHHDLVGGSLSGAIALASTPHGVGMSPAGGNYFLAPAGTLIDSNGAGNDINVNFRFSVTFVITSNAAADAIASLADTPTSGGPQILIQNNAGSLRALVAGSTYHTFGSVDVGQIYTVDVTYTDLSPYTWATRVNGQIVSTLDSYWNPIEGILVPYVGTGFGGATANAVILQATLEQGAHVDLSDSWALERGANPWAIYAPIVRRIPLAVGAAATTFIPIVGRGPGMSLARVGGGLANRSRV